MEWLFLDVDWLFLDVEWLFLDVEWLFLDVEWLFLDVAWNSYFTSWNAEVYYILLVLFLLSRAFASKHFAMTVYVRKLKFVEFMLFISKLLGRFVFLAGRSSLTIVSPLY